jgi:hypothetical protein
MVTYSNLGKYGRLGNQMFQIASTIGIAKKNNHEFFFPEWICYYNGINCQNFFEDKLPSKKIDIEKKYIEEQFTYSEIILNEKVDYDLFGYFQSQKYFEQCTDLVRKYFSPKKTIVESLISEFKNHLNNSCSIHVRRGDYLNHPSIYYTHGIEYYIKAVDYIKKNRGEHVNFLIFSEDLNWCRENFNINNFTDENFIFVDTKNHVKDMILMSLCNDNIITNSTFSWWSAWLNNNSNKIVVVPKNWFTPDSGINDRDLNLSDWFMI